MELGKRLQTVASLVPKGHVVADIGTDHAHLPIYLITKGISPKVIATEIRCGPYKKALENIKKAGLQKVIELRLGAGLKPISPGEARTAVISGMGGEAIIEIIKESREVALSLDFLILQPMRNQANLRRELFQMGFKIENENVIAEGKRFYEVLVARKACQGRYDEIDVVVGPVLRLQKNSTVTDYIKERISRLESLIELLKKMETEAGRAALEKYQKELNILREVIT
ncbi:tRNA (adenine(22)-N(1))-methyltransferase [Thermoanaerobacterium sp. DL9XJH110]|uniref:tRNA (adenine(22)-N(1))-methyltransferase n=1 Tax=Thermoanaerobacterium sp. DL9XJH110 TaxID=3386643 RepID=UPI003BB6EE8F